MNENVSESRASKVAGLLFVVAIHFGLVYAAMSYKLIPPPQEAVTLMVNLINPPKKEEPPPPEPPKPLPKKVELVKEKPIVQPKPQPAPVLVAQAPITSAAEPVAPPPPVEPIKEPSPPSEPVVEVPPKPAGPVHLSELSLGCPERTEPNYPPASRRTGEQGQVKLRVELDEEGHINNVKVVTSSGHMRLDNAGINAVKSWRCNPATRDGKAVRAVALQTFDFILEGN
ncbi:MAG: TonB family protein [Methylotenera sp.]|nr:TonB family protein [Methylotenera sp.]